jgi:hypothetical protein
MAHAPLASEKPTHFGRETVGDQGLPVGMFD